MYDKCLFYVTSRKPPTHIIFVPCVGIAMAVN